MLETVKMRKVKQLVSKIILAKRIRNGKLLILTKQIKLLQKD